MEVKFFVEIDINDKIIDTFGVKMKVPMISCIYFQRIYKIKIDVIGHISQNSLFLFRLDEIWN